MFHSLFLSIPFFCLSISSKFFLLPFLSFINMCYYLLMSIRKFLSQNPWTLSVPNTFSFGGLPNCCLNLAASIMISSCILLSYAFFDLIDPFYTFIMYYILGANIAPNFLLLPWVSHHAVLSSMTLSRPLFYKYYFLSRYAFTV